MVEWAPACPAEPLFTHIHDAQTNAHQPVGPDSSCQFVAVAQQVRETNGRSGVELWVHPVAPAIPALGSKTIWARPVERVPERSLWLWEGQARLAGNYKVRLAWGGPQVAVELHPFPEAAMSPFLLGSAGTIHSASLALGGTDGSHAEPGDIEGTSAGKSISTSFRNVGGIEKTDLAPEETNLSY